MKHTGTKALSWLLSIALVLSLMPCVSLTAYASEYSEGDDASIFSISVGDTFDVGSTITRNNSTGVLQEIYVDDYCVFKYYGPGTYTVNENLTLTAVDGVKYYFDSTDTNDLTNATVTVDTAKASTTVKIGDKNVGPAKYDVKYGSTLENATADFPTQAGSYYAFVTAKETAGNYIGQAKSEAFTVSAEGAVTWTDISANKSQDGISITSSGVDFTGNYISGYNGSITFTSTAGKIKKIEISSNDQKNMNVFGNISSGWNECWGDGPLVWNGTASDSVILSARTIDIMYFSQAVFTIEAPSDISDATVTVDTDNQRVSVTRGNAFIPEDDYEVTYGADAEHATLTDFPTKAGTYVAVVTAKTDSIYYKGSVTSAEFTIPKADVSIISLPTASAITYGQTLADSALTGGTAKSGDSAVEGTFTWKNGEIKPTVSDSDAIEYDVAFTPTDADNYETVECKVKLTVNKAAPTVVAPTAKTGLVYTGSAQELVNAGSATGGTMYYAVTTENKAPTDENLYTTSIPTATTAGTYYVWYKVVGDDNHNDTAADCVTVTIAEKIYTVTFNSNGGSEVAAQTVTSGGKAAKPADPTNGDLHFMGWFVNPTLETLYDTSGDTLKLNTFNFDTEITEDLTLKALWGAQMNVNILGGGGRIDVVKSGDTPELDDEYPMQSAVMNAVLGIYDSFTLGAKAQDGNRFVNWVRQTSEDNYEDYSTDAQINVIVTENLSLYAVFEPTVFTIMYDSNGGSYVDSQTDADALPDPLPVPTQSGYTFGGWFTDSDLTTAAVPGASITENTLLYAKWNAVPVYSYDDEDTPPVTSVTVPVSGDDEKVNVTVRVSGDTATVTTANVDKVLAAEEVGTVTIDVSALKESVSEVVLPAAMVTKIVDAVADQENNADSLEIKLPAGTVTFDADAVAAIGSQAEGRSLRLNLEDIGEKKLNSAQKAAVEELDVQEVLDAYMTAGGQRIRDFRGGRATVTVSYELKEGQTGRGVIVWYVADDGEKTEMPSTYDGKDVKFTVEHFSNYVIAYDEQRAAACPQDDTCPVSAFTDTDPGAWYHDGVHYALEKGLMNGVGDNQFDPNGTASRGMIVTILYRMEGEPEAAAENPFGDVVDGQWYTNAVIWAAENKIVDGYGGGKFGPNDHITREQLVTVMYRYARYKGVDVSVGEDTNILSYDDAFDVSEWAIPAMQWAVGSGTVEGRTETTLNPKDTATRAEIATIIMRYCAEIAG